MIVPYSLYRKVLIEVHKRNYQDAWEGRVMGHLCKVWLAHPSLIAERRAHARVCLNRRWIDVQPDFTIRAVLENIAQVINQERKEN